MPKLSEPMRAALRMADRHGALIKRWGRWTHASARPGKDRAVWPRHSWTAHQSTINALTGRGLLQYDALMENRVITPEGRAAIGQGEGGADAAVR